MPASLETDVFEHFRVLRREDGTLWELGRGAMGVTFKAVDTRLDALVALKVISARILADAASHERFRREARAAASVRHPNVASVYHFGQEGTNCFYAMEFVEGESVAAAVKARGPFPWAAVLDIARQTAAALGAVHARRIVHRDLKPDNLMLTREQGSEEDAPQVKLIDFGLAKSLLKRPDAEPGSLTVGFLGTPYYASPEQFEEEDCDIRSDLYSLGATLWYLLTGKPPFTGNVVQVFEQHLNRPPPFGALPAGVPPAVHRLLARLLAKEPDERPQTPAGLRREIDACRREAGPAPAAEDHRTRVEATPPPSAQIPDAGETVVIPPPAAPLSPAPALPVPLTRFFGREKEIETLCTRLRDGQRLITITGSGGSGKTRLALEVAHRAVSLLGRQTFFVGLSDLRDARFLVRRVRDAVLPMAALEDADASAASLLGPIASALSARPALLLLDNFEHLVEDGADFVAALLARVESLSCLITSRRRLDLDGEREFALSALSVPPVKGAAIPLERLAEYASVRLFLDRAQAVRADFELNDHNAGAVAELCRKLEGIPLAVELAAARAEVLTPQQIVTRLAESLNFLVGGKKDAAARHRTLRATLDWSHELLSPELRLFFARLSVFRGGWTAEAAAALEGGADEDETLAHLSALRRYSLILAEERGETMRYRLLETVRQYAGEQLARLGDGEAVAVRGRHRDFFLALALQAEPELRKSDQAHWLDLLETEHANFRVALARTNDGDPAQRSLAYNLHRFWMIHGHLIEGREWLSRALTDHAGDGAASTDPLVAKTHNASGVLAWAAGDLRAAQAHLERSLACFEAMEDAAGTASAFNNLGIVAGQRADLDAARARYEASIALYRRQDVPALLAAVLSNLGRVLFKQLLYPDARRCLEESLALGAASADRFSRANILASLGAVEAHDNDLAAAYRRFEECLTIRLELGDADNFEVCWRMAGIAAGHGDHRESARLLAAADAIRRSLSLQPAPETAAQFQADLDAVATRMDAADFADAWNEGKTMTPKEIIQRCRAKIA